MPAQKVTREEIMLKSQVVITRQGYYNTSMNELAEACGVQKGSFYHYFPSKEGLMKEILENTRTVLQEKVFKIAYDETLTPAERLSKLLVKLGKILFMQQGGCFIGNTTLETAGNIPDFKKILRGIIEDWIDALQHLFKKKYPDETALRLAQQTVMEFEGAVMMKQLFDDEQLLIDVYTRTLAKL
jgi:TetR/AcrR family transcriptional repressor of nem operon